MLKINKVLKAPSLWRENFSFILFLCINIWITRMRKCENVELTSGANEAISICQKNLFTSVNDDLFFENNTHRKTPMIQLF